MKKLALAATALTLGIAAASAQSQPGEGGTIMLTPEQRAAVRSIVRERLPTSCGRSLQIGLRIGLKRSRQSSAMPSGLPSGRGLRRRSARAFRPAFGKDR